MNTFITWINHLLTFSSAKLSACQVLSTWQIQTRFWCRKLVSLNVCNRHVWHFSSVRLSSLEISEIIYLKRKWHYFRVTEFHNKWECSLIKFDYTCPWNPLALLCESLRCTVVIRIIRPWTVLCLQGSKLSSFPREPNYICIETSTSLGSLQKSEEAAGEIKGPLISSPG